LLLRARELCGSRADVDAEDLLGDTYLKLVAKPPSPKTALQLKHWMRTVMLRIWLNVREREGELEVVSYEAELSKQRAN
jgi:DNA-directed RNA polymerase specialized sigma24 family protein